MEEFFPQRRGRFAGSASVFIASMRHAGGIAATSWVEAAKRARKSVDLAYILKNVVCLVGYWGVQEQ